MADKCTDEQRQADEQDSQAVMDRLQREIGKRKQLEEALAVSNAEFRDFVRTMSHDLREPLRKISSFGVLLKESIEDTLEKQDRENLDLVIDGAERMTRMIEDVLTYSRTNAITVTPETIDLSEIVERLEQWELAALKEEAGATIDIRKPLPRVCADAVLIQQLLRNLIVAAIQGRRRDVPLRILIQAAPCADGTIRIEVQDNGRGIAVHDGKDVFKMFARLYQEQEKEEAGTRLAVCKKIVDKHSGRIGVTSEAGAGSTFWFTLPASADEP